MGTLVLLKPGGEHTTADGVRHEPGEVFEVQDHELTAFADRFIVQVGQADDEPETAVTATPKATGRKGK
ncbi:hypothetical protein PZC41_14245 [Staphylococcus aureus]|uniref:hypothetical protein n=1 Tax=Staphylococcus aureus TaxID=1280 RepID=UPI0023AF2F5D|nr:hypothetical protein [Staphylococcus aureus]MDE8535465.1 hypothetical protein [Staphylococcus aureus]